MIALGTQVKFTEIAFVVRKWKGVWGIPKRGNFTAPSLELERETRFLVEPRSETNKSVVALPARGTGIVIGLERKLIGRSESPSGGHGFEDDWEPGWFDQTGKVDLYVVKSELRGKAFYVPQESLEVV